MSNEALMAIIVALVAAHYLSVIWEIRKLRDDIDALRREVSAAALTAAHAASAAAGAAVSAATVASRMGDR